MPKKSKFLLQLIENTGTSGISHVDLKTQAGIADQTEFNKYYKVLINKGFVNEFKSLAVSIECNCLYCDWPFLYRIHLL